ncbi:MAG: hypothetical protein QOH93_1936 [Chloroflexia bacterium]|jgi:hypothetical protein|nr:hypothetical protein [Chloroflexia bacterium]
MARQYAQIVGVVLLLLGVLGLVLGEGHLAGALNIDLPEDIVHLVVGAVFAYLGFGRVDGATVKMVVGVVGVVLLLVGIVGFIDPKGFGLIPSGWTVVDNIIHLLLGLLGIAAGFLLDRDTTVTVR